MSNKTGGGFGASLPPGYQNKRAALVIAHPGHELRAYGWLIASSPTVSVLTDGSGHTGQSRLDSTTRLLQRAGARLGPVYGRFTDSQIYESILCGRHQVFTTLAFELGKHFIEHGIEYVVSDAIEGYNPTHDLCRLVVDCAVAIANSGNPLVEQFEFLLEGSPQACPDHLKDESILLALDQQTYALKVEAAREYRELETEVDDAFSSFGADAYRFECLMRVVDFDPTRRFAFEAPYYELYGERQVAAGYYRQVLLYSKDFAPVARALRAFSTKIGQEFSYENSDHQ
jgi:hypothetical protein